MPWSLRHCQIFSGATNVVFGYFLRNYSRSASVFSRW